MAILKYQYSYRVQDKLGRWRLSKDFHSFKREYPQGFQFILNGRECKIESLERIWLCEQWFDVAAKLVYRDSWESCANSTDKYITPRQAELLLRAVEYTSESGFLELTAKLLDFVHILGLEQKGGVKYAL